MPQSRPLAASAGATSRGPRALPRRAALVLAIACAAAFALSACSKPAAPPRPQSEVGVVTVKTERLVLDNALPGRTRAYQASDVRPQVGGILLRRLFTEGADVKAGQALYEIDPATYQAAYDTAKGELAQAEADVLAARPKAERYRNLVALDAVSKQDGDDTVATLRKAEAAVVAAKATLRSARINLGYTRITAPISGRIGTSASTPGALVTAQQETALTKIQQLDPIYVDVTQSSAQMLRLRRQFDAGKLKAVDGKAEVHIQLEDGSAYARTGTLEFVGASVDETTGSVTLRAVVPNPDHLLLPGMYVKAVLPMAVDEQAILVPQQAVSRNTKGEATALVVGADGKVAQQVLGVSQTHGDRWVVTSGLQAGDKVIVEGTQNVVIGQAVKTVEAGARASATAGPASATAAAGKQA
ncbi:MexE family multidrug efflux RND transporter periplasmic adaptor subunit [Cupriavidus sp. TA19]|uniref:efflux RND transporter periplasmic adaptor subunit n=1 Tax=unclassified Cupriavidus TaxID=2640874 RepID=UPI000E2FD1FE|nr:MULTISPECIES: efflux RND transporter periplasmic adaptor subunit [unclassified Cupriavidus]BDB28360.1 efflux RND transporter periplasmic adaptor subunit [Cupriavidus sp. P-10]GLC91125.1 MexE family multidrug efflux RND transporter periplasmic adaptor subunit [Cupriavidus sp. TA19]